MTKQILLIIITNYFVVIVLYLFSLTKIKLIPCKKNSRFRDFQNCKFRGLSRSHSTESWVLRVIVGLLPGLAIIPIIDIVVWFVTLKRELQCINQWTTNLQRQLARASGRPNSKLGCTLFFFSEFRKKNLVLH